MTFLDNNTSNNDANFNAQQRQIITTNRPRNLVNIVTSIQDEDQNEQTYQQRGVKRTCELNFEYSKISCKFIPKHVLSHMIFNLKNS